MGKLALLILFTTTLFANSCIECHEKKGLNSQKIHYRYLMLYSSNKIIFNKIENYLKNPSLKNSSMPKQMLKRFGTHPKIEFSKEDILNYIDKFSIQIEIK